MRIPNRLIAILTLALLAIIALGSRYGERYSLSRDAKEAERDILAIDTAERACFEKVGRFVSREDGCDSVSSAVAKAESHGYAVMVVSKGSDYSIRIVPSVSARLVSLYIDRSGTLHLGTKAEPASPNTMVYHDHR